MKNLKRKIGILEFAIVAYLVFFVNAIELFAIKTGYMGATRL